MTASREETKIWFDLETNTPIFVDPFSSNHSRDVLEHPEKYRLPADFFADKSKTYKNGYDGYILSAAMRKGFVRIAIDYKNQDTNSNVEGLGLGQIQPATIWLKNFIGRMARVVIVVRTGLAHMDGKSFVLDTPEKIDFFLKWGRILQDGRGAT